MTSTRLTKSGKDIFDMYDETIAMLAAYSSQYKNVQARWNRYTLHITNGKTQNSMSMVILFKDFVLTFMMPSTPNGVSKDDVNQTYIMNVQSIDSKLVDDVYTNLCAVPNESFPHSVLVGEGTCRIHAYSDRSIIFQFNYELGTVNKDNLVIRNTDNIMVIPHHYVNISGYWSYDRVTKKLTQISNNISSELQKEWCRELITKFPRRQVPGDKVIALNDEFSRDGVIYINSIAKRVGIMRSTVANYKKILGFENGR